MMGGTAITGMLYSVVAFLFFTCFDTTTKYLSQEFSVFQIMAVEFAVATLLLLFTVFMDKTRPARDLLRVGSWRLHLARGVTQIIGQSLVFIALPHLTLAEFYVIVFCMPMMVSLFSSLTLKEKITWPLLLGLGVGFVGVIIALRPDQGIDFWTIIAFAGMAVLAASLVILRRMMASETPNSAAISTSAFLAVGSLLATLFVYKDMPWNAFMLMTLGGVLFAVAQFMLTRAYQLAPAGLASMPQFLQLIFGAGAGYLVFGDKPNGWIYLGGAVVIGANVFLILAQRRQKA